MSFKLENHVHMTTSTTGDKATPYALTPLSGYRDFGDYMVATDTTWYVCYDVEDPVHYEAGLGTFNGTTLARTTIIDCTDSPTQGVDWPSGTRDIVCGIPASVFTSQGGTDFGILDNTLPQGFVVKKSAVGALLPRFEGRELETDNVANLTISNPKGTSGNPRFALPIDLDDFLQLVAGADETHRTMLGELVLAALTTRITGFDATNKDHIIRDGLSGEDMIRLVQVGGDPEEMEMYLREGGGTPAWVRAMTISQMAAYLPIVDAAQSSSTVTTTVTSDSTLGVAIPATGSWTVVYHANISARWANVNVKNKEVGANILSTTTAPTGYSVDGMMYAPHWNSTEENPQYNCSLTGFVVVPSASNSTTYTFKVDNWDLQNAALYVAGGHSHQFVAHAFRTA